MNDSSYMMSYCLGAMEAVFMTDGMHHKKKEDLPPFTEASIGKHVAVYINGKYMFAPRVNQRISGGRCAISDLTPEEINSLFKNAEKIAPKHPVDTIEIFDF